MWTSLFDLMSGIEPAMDRRMHDENQIFQPHHMDFKMSCHHFILVSAEALSGHTFIQFITTVNFICFLEDSRIIFSR